MQLLELTGQQLGKKRRFFFQIIPKTSGETGNTDCVREKEGSGGLQKAAQRTGAA